MDKTYDVRKNKIINSAAGTKVIDKIGTGDTMMCFLILLKSTNDTIILFYHNCFS